MDVLMCVGPEDVDGLFPIALQLLGKHCSWVRTAHVVCPEPSRARRQIRRLGSISLPEWTVHHDQEIVGTRGMALPGWIRQQLIKLLGDRVCKTENFVCVGADALILEDLGVSDLVWGNLPILRAHRYSYPNRHLFFERARVLKVAKLLGVEPLRSFLPGDFVCDVFTMHGAHLQALRAHFVTRFGPEGLLRVLRDLGEREGADNRFGEWSTYSVFVLDVLGLRSRLSVGEPRWAKQIHSTTDLLRPDRYSARIVHFAQQPNGIRAVIADLVAAGRLEAKWHDSMG